MTKKKENKTGFDLWDYDIEELAIDIKYFLNKYKKQRAKDREVKEDVISALNQALELLWKVRLLVRFSKLGYKLERKGGKL